MAYLLYRYIKKKRAKKAAGPAIPTAESETPGPTPAGGIGANKLAAANGSAATIPGLTVSGETNGQLGQAEKGVRDVEDLCNSPAAARARTICRWKLIGGPFFPFTVAALDTTMRSSPRRRRP